jgi:hypothetical protein
VTLDQFQSRFKEISALGFMPSLRGGDTGVGHTLEQLLGLTENNIALPDLGNIELKAHRSPSTSLITLFTFNRKAWIMNPMVAIRKYGIPDENGRLGLYFTMSLTPSSAGVFLNIERDTLQLRHIDGTVIANWDLTAIAGKFVKKIPALILVTASSEERNGREFFWFRRAQLLEGSSAAILREQFAAHNVVLDLRLHDAKTRARNHGTGFRTSLGNLPKLFAQVTDL